ncbi:MAG: precorrin-3B C(17)-methyltransferase [Lachnospiraceae bacterium]|nr:precorrin-3B C(17)-methyltransferase [Lachnospiraceae bacterium]
MIYVVGFGPGDRKRMTNEAEEAIASADVVVGYTGYTALMKPLFPDKDYLETGMRGEIARCEVVVDLAQEGKNVALICSGDAGIYGMAALLLEILDRRNKTEEIDVHIVAGVTAALAGAALLGAPLGHDLAFISLSDLLTPWEVIEKRLLAAGDADFCIALYNPSSKGRKDHLKKACDLLLTVKDKDTVCGIADRIGREGEQTRILSLSELGEAETDMQSVVLIGNSMTKRVGDRMVTERGYLNKYG